MPSDEACRRGVVIVACAVIECEGAGGRSVGQWSSAREQVVGRSVDRSVGCGCEGSGWVGGDRSGGGSSQR